MLLTSLGAAGWELPPVVRRGEGTRSGAPSWTTAQTQAVQGCTVCVVPPDLLPEPREPDVGGRTSGGGLSFGDFSLATQRKVTRQAAQRRRNPAEDGVLVSCTAKPCHLDGYISPSKDVTQPLTLTLSRKGRGDGYRGRLRFANRPYSTQFDPIRSDSTLQIAPSVASAWGMGTAPEADGNAHRGATLAPWRRRGRPAGLR